MTAARLKIVRTSELAAFERAGWIRSGLPLHDPFGDDFELIEWGGAGEPVTPVLPVLHPLRRNRMRAAG